jgi:hypothetical protein
MKVKLTEKFHPNRKGHVVDLSDKFAEALIKDGKAVAVDAKEKAKTKGNFEDKCFDLCREMYSKLLANKSFERNYFGHEFGGRRCHSRELHLSGFCLIS